MNNKIILLYPKGSEYPKVSEQELTEAGYISAVINASSVADSILQLVDVNLMLEKYPYCDNKMSFLINDTSILEFPETTLDVLRRMRIFIQVTDSKNLETTILTAIDLGAMLVLPKEFINKETLSFEMSMSLAIMKMNNHLMNDMPSCAKKLSL